MMGITTLSTLLGLFHLAHAISTENCTFDTIVPSKELLWCSCDDGFLCSRLEVGSLSIILFCPLMLTKFRRSRWITTILTLARPRFPLSSIHPSPILRRGLIKELSYSILVDLEPQV